MSNRIRAEIYKKNHPQPLPESFFLNSEKPSPILSVMTITKNEKDVISGWYDDIYRQTIRNQIEIIGCDSSDDGTEKIVKRRADKGAICSSCRFADARNQCASLAKADMLLFTDVDIRYPSATFLEDAIRLFKEGNAQIAGIANVLQPDGTLTHSKLTGQFILMYKNVFTQLGGFGRFLQIFNVWEDVDLAMKARGYGYRIYSIPLTIRHLRPQKKWMFFK